MNINMNITSAQYVATSYDSSINDNIKAVIDGVEMHIPLDPTNSHYAEILRQVADGTLTIADAD